MVRAHWNGTVIAESDDTVVIDGNHYFPARRRSLLDRFRRETSVVAAAGIAGHPDAGLLAQATTGRGAA